MVKLTMDMIVRKQTGALKRRKEETLDGFLTKLTHLNLENRQLDEIGNELHNCPNLLALYLYDNKLSKIPDTSSLTHLSSLYLQNNNITTIENLTTLGNLKKLYLGGNALCVIEGLENLRRLEEMYVENQRLLPGESLVFDPQSIFPIAKSLKILNVSGNNLNSLEVFKPCTSLVNFNASKNKLYNMDEVIGVIEKNWNNIVKLDFTGNPITSKPKYKDRLILATIDTIGVIDGKEISAFSKNFLKGMHANVESKSNRPHDDHHDVGCRGTQMLEGHGVKRISNNMPRSQDLPPEGHVIRKCPDPSGQKGNQGSSLSLTISRDKLHPRSKTPANDSKAQNKPKRPQNTLLAPPSSAADFYTDRLDQYEN